MLLKIHEIGRWFLLHRMRFVSKVIDKLIFLLFSCVIPSETEIGAGTVLAHGGLGNVFHPKAKIGERVLIAHDVTLGGKSDHSHGFPRIGNDVYIGAGARILGDVEVGDDCLIGANSVVIESVPAGCMVAGVPAKIKRTGIRARDFETW